MRFASASIGFVSLLLLPGVVHALGMPTLYDEMRMFTEYDRQDFVSELPVQRFAPLVLGDEKFPVEEKHVDISLQKKYATVCADIETKIGTVWINECQGFAEKLSDLAKKEARIRALGRELQLIASSYEPEMDGNTGRENAIATKLPGATLLWQSGIDRMTNPVDQVRVKRLELPDIKQYTDAIAGILGGMVEAGTAGGTPKQDYSELVAALFRYRNGYHEVQREGKSAVQLGMEEVAPGSFQFDCRNDADNPYEGTDLQMLGKRWCNLETEMHNIWTKLPGADFADLGPNDIAVFPVKKLRVPGASDVVLWVKRNDVGILWRMPLEPVLPTLIKDDTPVLSGRYPEPPVEPEPKHGICSHPFARRGYLCRKQLAEHCPIQGEEFDDNENKITLAACQAYASPILETQSGPDICQRGGWRTPTDLNELKKDTPQKDGDTLSAGACANCVVDLYCASASVGKTYVKKDTGIIELAIQEDPIMDPHYIIIHELIRAQQICNLAPNPAPDPNVTIEKCCETEYLPYFIACKATAEDGLLDTTNISVEECASMLANKSCGQGEYACTGPPADEAAYQKKLQELTDALKDKSPQTCADAITNIDGRALSIKESLKTSCRPGCEAQYDNTIGNNLCYIGQCLEESLEEHRLIPGRIPYVTQDEAFPWDSCMNDDPQFATFVSLPPLTRTFLPQYRGQELLQQLDTLLCQINGLPRLSPPVLCAFRPGKRLSLPLQTYFNMALSLVGQDETQIDDAANLQESVGNIATRMGTALYKEYLEKALREFSELISAASTFGRQMGEAAFPTVACPRNATGNSNNCAIFR